MIRAAARTSRLDQVQQQVRVRLGRQSLLTQDDPVDLWVVLDEAVLSRPVGGDAVMRGQLQRLVEVAELPNVTLQVLPFEVGAHAGMDGTFTILSFPNRVIPMSCTRRTPRVGSSWRRATNCRSTASSLITFERRPCARRNP